MGPMVKLYSMPAKELLEVGTTYIGSVNDIVLRSRFQGAIQNLVSARWSGERCIDSFSIYIGPEGIQSNQIAR